MRFIILVKATKDSEKGVMPSEKLLAEMGGYHEELAKYSKGQRSFVDGPFAETKELVAGYTIINVKSRDEAIQWTRRFPNPAVDGGEAEIEVRPYYELEDFGDSPEIERFRKLEAERKK